MRSFSNAFAALLTSDKKRPRFVLQVSFSGSSADDVWIKSHSDIDLTAVTGTVLAAKTQSISVLSQQVFPDDGRSTIGNFSFDAVDVSGSLTTAQRTALVTNSHGLRYRTVKLWVGFAELTFSQYETYATQIVNEVKFGSSVYTFTCSDIQREIRKTVMVPTKLALAQPIDAVTTTIPINGDTSQIQALKHDAVFSDAPSLEVAYIKIDDEIIRIPVAGIVANQFTGVTRGVLATRAADHDTDTGLTAERQKSVDEVIYLEMNAVKLAYALLTGILLNQSPFVMPTGWHAGIAASFVNLTAFQNVGIDLYDGTDTGGVILRFLGVDSEDCKGFIEKQIMKIIGCYMPVQSSGQLSLKRLEKVIHGAAPVSQLTDRDLIGPVTLTYSMKQIYNRLQIAWNAIDANPTRFTEIDDADSIAKWQASDVRVIEAFGLHGSIHSADTVRRLFERYRDRYSGPPLLTNVKARLALAALEVGDIVRLQSATAKDFTDPRTSGTIDRAAEIQGVSLDWMNATLAFDLFGSTQAAAPLPAASTSQAISDAWFTSAGTDISGLAGVIAGHMTTNKTFAGGASNQSAGSIWYFNGDLTIDSGVVLTVSGNVQLRIKGVLTINGSIQGQGGGLAGVADTLVATSWPYFDPANRTPYNGVSVQLGQTGYYGSPRAQGGLREAIRNEDTGTQSFADLQSFAAPATTIGIDIVPTLQIAWDGTKVTGIPTDLRGCSGGPGGKWHFSQTHSTNFQTILAGGTGGASGAGVLIVSRGTAFGASGFVDLSGVDGLVGNSASWWDNPAVGGHFLTQAGASGGGAGGAPGAFIVVVDGVLNPLPVLNSATVIANYGLTPQLVAPSPPAPFTQTQYGWFSGKIDYPGGPRPVSARSYYESPTSGLKAGLAAARALYLALPQTAGVDVPNPTNSKSPPNLMPAGLADFERIPIQNLRAIYSGGGTGTIAISTLQQWLGLQSLQITPVIGTARSVQVWFSNATGFYNIPVLPKRRYLVVFSIYPTNADSQANLQMFLDGAVSGASSAILDMTTLTLNTWSRCALQIDMAAVSDKTVNLSLYWNKAGTTTTAPIFYIDGLELLDVTNFPDWTVDNFQSDFIPAGGSAVSGLAFDGGARMLGTYATPESVIVAPPASTAFDQTNGDAYLKVTGTGNTGWKRIASEDYVDAAVTSSTEEVYNETGSIQTTIAASGNVAHGLSGKPNWMRLTLVCTTAEKGYSIGDEYCGPIMSASGQLPGFTSDATKLYWSADSASWFIQNKAAITWTAITNADWKLILRAGMGAHPGGISDGTKNEVVVSSSGTNWRVKDHVLPHYDLIREGCVGDGVTNDTAAFAAACAKCIADGSGALYVNDGHTFLIDNYTLATAGITIRLFSHGSGCLKLRTSANSIIRCNNATAAITLDGVLLDGNNLSLINTSNGLALCTAGRIVVIGPTKMYNAGVAASNTGAGLASQTGGELYFHAPAEIHDTAGYGARVQGTGKAQFLGGYIHDTGNSNLFCGANTPVVSDGIIVSNMHLANARADAGGTGANGNNLNFFKIDNFTVGNCIFDAPAFSWLRVNLCNDYAIGPCNGSDAGETGYWFELGCTQFAISGLKGRGCQRHGLCVTNVNNGAENMQITGCQIIDYGKDVGFLAAGIVCENGIVSGCLVDGKGNTGAVWNYKVSPGAGTNNLSWQTQFEGCRSAGGKYDVGVCISANGTGTRRMIVRGINNIRKDANYSSPIGGVGGSDTDAGNGSQIGTAMAQNIFWETNYFNVPFLEAPPAGEIGSRMKIDGMWMVSDGHGWNTERVRGMRHPT
jgi:hypothetical protein